MSFHMAEYCDTPQSKEKRNREYKACLNERAILRLLDHAESRNSDVFVGQAMGLFGGDTSLSCSFCLRHFCSPLVGLFRLGLGCVEVN